MPNTFIAQVRRTCPLDAAVVDCTAELTPPGPLRVANTVAPAETVMSRYTSLWTPGWVCEYDIVAVTAVEELPPAVEAVAVGI